MEKGTGPAQPRREEPGAEAVTSDYQYNNYKPVHRIRPRVLSRGLLYFGAFNQQVQPVASYISRTRTRTRTRTDVHEVDFVVPVANKLLARASLRQRVYQKVEIRGGHRISVRSAGSFEVWRDLRCEHASFAFAIVTVASAKCSVEQRDGCRQRERHHWETWCEIFAVHPDVRVAVQAQAGEAGRGSAREQLEGWRTLTFSTVVRQHLHIVHPTTLQPATIQPCTVPT